MTNLTMSREDWLRVAEALWSRHWRNVIHRTLITADRGDITICVPDAVASRATEPITGARR